KQNKYFIKSEATGGRRKVTHRFKYLLGEEENRKEEDAELLNDESTLDNWAREFNRLDSRYEDQRQELLREQVLTCKFDVIIASYEIVIREKSTFKKVVGSFEFYSSDVFADNESFDEWFQSDEDKNDSEDTVVSQLHKVLKPFLLRRIKADVEKSLLPKQELNVYVKMSEMQSENDIDAVNGANKKESKTRLLNIVMQLRKCCNHPYLFEGAEPGPPYTTDEHLVYNSQKDDNFGPVVEEVSKRRLQSVDLFPQMSGMLDILEDYCFSVNRINAIDEYNKPEADLQAMDRAHRIGQTKQVKVFRFVTENAIEEKVLKEPPRNFVWTNWLSNKAETSENELLDMIQYGAADMFASSDSANGEVDIEDLLKHSESKTKELTEKYAQLNLNALQHFTNDESVYEWNGENFKKKEPTAITNIGHAWVNPG
ncbi:hypothetical protein G9P44_001983, partial [Scheffersomyces stipitis]